MKKFINHPDTIVAESLAGLAAAHADLLRYDPEAQVVVRLDAPLAGKVGIVSGGGSGHEPLHGGFVGRGMLSAACPGAIFTSPVPDQMAAATRAVNGGAGVVHLVKNYTGDVLNFRMGAELAEDDGIEVASVLIDDDVAVEDSTWTSGRRGVGATVLAEKIAGAAAERGAPLKDVAALATKVNDRSRSFGIALTSCVTPAAGAPTFDIGDDEIELGVGIHGEPGRRRGPLQPAADLVEVMCTAVLDDRTIPAGEPVLVFVNGLGGTPAIELYLIFNEVAQRLQKEGLPIARSLVGNYITSLDMAGASLTLLHLDEELLGLWDDPVHTPALRWGM